MRLIGLEERTKESRRFYNPPNIKLRVIIKGKSGGGYTLNTRLGLE